MNKTMADRFIHEYLDKIFGFALDRTRNIEQARELASDIVYEVYRSFLAKDDIVNLDGYVYRISRNVWARFVRKLEQGRNTESIDDIVIPCCDEDDADGDGTVAALRREIGFLSERQRLVICLHYYDGLSVKDISSRLNISPGTVKWHLSDARTKLKEGIIMETNQYDLDLNPIKFLSMGHSGTPGKTGDTAEMFHTRLKQNIAWACYFEAKTVEEIARAVGVPRTYVADELAKLVEYAYVDKLDNSSNPKYRTNMVITDARVPFDYGGLYEQATKLLCVEFFPDLFEALEADPEHFGLSCDGNDLNFIKYALIMLAIRRLRKTQNAEEFLKYAVKRPDGGCFIARATVDDDRSAVPEEPNPNWVCGYMTRDRYDKPGEWKDHPRKAYYSLSLDCRFTDRQGGWRDNLNSDWGALVRFMDSGKDSLGIEEYKRLCDKGYLFEDRVQPVILRLRPFDDETLFDSLDRLCRKYVAVSDRIARFDEKFRQSIFEVDRSHYPTHIQPVVAFMSQDHGLGDATFIPRVIGQLLKNRELKPLTEIQRKAALSVLCVVEGQ